MVHAIGVRLCMCGFKVRKKAKDEKKQHSHSPSRESKRTQQTQLGNKESQTNEKLLK